MDRKNVKQGEGDISDLDGENKKKIWLKINEIKQRIRLIQGNIELTEAYIRISAASRFVLHKADSTRW